MKDEISRGIKLQTASKVNDPELNAAIEEFRLKLNTIKDESTITKKLFSLNGIKEVKINIREGRCQKIDNTFQQKGVDTLLTIDLSRIPKMEGIFDVIVLTSDTDFVPVINDLFEDKINVILAYFTDKKRKSGLSLSNHLWKACKDKIKIRKEYFLNK